MRIAYERVREGFGGKRQMWFSGLVVYLDSFEKESEFESPVAFCVRIWDGYMGFCSVELVSGLRL